MPSLMKDSAAPRERATVLDQRGDTQRNLLEALLQRPEGLTVEQIVEKLGVTANAVRQHLAVLERDAFVAHEVRPAPRGRPRHVYFLSAQGRETFPRRYKELAEVVLAELGEHLRGDALARTLRRTGARAAAALDAERVPVAETARLMKRLGYAATATSPGEIVARNCVFHELAQRFPAVCEFDLGFMEAATGRKVEHRECMVRGGAVCRFRFAGKDK
jgi:predicted ArsR family transcriptional regulator